MAVELDRGFSIREHVAKMRSTRVGKCGPFEGETLPPMDVRKFRWWSDEVAASAAAVAAGVRQKTPRKKKRSIVELFAISPQITGAVGGGEPVGSSSDEEEEEEEERVEEVSGGGGLYYADLAAVSRREGKERALQGKDCRGGEKGGKRVKRKLQIKICAAKKEKTQKKPKIRSSLSISQLLQEVKRKKMLTKSLKLSFQAKTKKKKRKQFPSILSGKENNLKLTPKPTPKSKTKNSSVQSILKREVKASPVEKHVTFSGNVDIFEREECSSLPAELALVQSTKCPVTGVPESVKDSNIGAEEPRITIVSNELGIENENESSQGKCVDLNKMSDTNIEIHEDYARERPEVMVEITRQPSGSCLIDKDQISHAGHSVTLPESNISSRDLISISSSTGSNKPTSTDTRLNTDYLSALCFSEEFIGLPLNSQGELAINPKPNLVPNSSELLKRNEMLPGPSGGVLFPGSGPVPAPLPVRPIGVASPASDVRMRPLYFKDKFGTEHYYAPLMPVRPGFGFTHLPGFERMEIQSYDPLLDHTAAPTNFYEVGKNNAEPTVRLMGKNVSLGRSSKDSAGWNRSVWVDKESAALNAADFPSRERRHGLSFSVEPRFNEHQGQVYSHAGIAFPGYSSQPVTHMNPVFTHYNSSIYQKPVIRQQVLLDSTHCKHTQSQSISFASSPNQAEAPQWIQNPRSKTHKPYFPTYVSPSVTQKQSYVVSGNRPNVSSPYPGTVISFPAYNSGSSSSHSRPISISPPTSAFNPPFLTARPDFASKSKVRVQNNPICRLVRPSDYINQNNKRPLERDDVLARPPLKKPFQSNSGSVTKSTGPDTIIGSEKVLDFGTRAGKAVDARVANTKLFEMGTGGFPNPVSGFVARSGPVKLSAGARHVLTPGPNLDRVNPRPIHSMMPLIAAASSSQRGSEELYRF